MAKINGQYIFVTNEDMTYGVDITEHVVEEGVSISDHVKRKAITLVISGEIVGDNAASVISRLKSIHHNGTVCKYVGRTSLSNCLISEFNTGHTHNIWGGCEFQMTLKEVRTTATSYKSTVNSSIKSTTKTSKKTGTQQIKKTSKVTYVYHTVKKGDTIWALVASSKAPYKKYGLSCNEVMKLNPSAFSRAGDFRTLQIGEKIIVGKRKG